MWIKAYYFDLYFRVWLLHRYDKARHAVYDEHWWLENELWSEIIIVKRDSVIHLRVIR